MCELLCFAPTLVVALARHPKMFPDILQFATTMRTARRSLRPGPLSRVAARKANPRELRCALGHWGPLWAREVDQDPEAELQRKPNCHKSNNRRRPDARGHPKHVERSRRNVGQDKSVHEIHVGPFVFQFHSAVIGSRLSSIRLCRRTWFVWLGTLSITLAFARQSCFGLRLRPHHSCNSPCGHLPRNSRTASRFSDHR